MYFPECFDSIVSMSDFKIQEANCICIVFTIWLLILIKIVLAVYKDAPLDVKATTIAIGISIIIVLSWSIKIFFMAGSNNHAIAAVDPATKKDKKSVNISFKKYFFI